MEIVASCGDALRGSPWGGASPDDNPPEVARLRRRRTHERNSNGPGTTRRRVPTPAGPPEVGSLGRCPDACSHDVRTSYVPPVVGRADKSGTCAACAEQLSPQVWTRRVHGVDNSCVGRSQGRDGRHGSRDQVVSGSQRIGRTTWCPSKGLGSSLLTRPAWPRKIVPSPVAVAGRVVPRPPAARSPRTGRNTSSCRWWRR